MAGCGTRGSEIHGTSFRGAKAADCAAENSASRRESCRWIRSLFPPQPTCMVVTIGVSDNLAERAPLLHREHLESKPILKTKLRVRDVEAEGAGRNDSQPVMGVWEGRGGSEGSGAEVWGTSDEAIIGDFIQGVR